MAVNVGRLTDEEQMSVKMWFYKSTKKKKKNMDETREERGNSFRKMERKRTHLLIIRKKSDEIYGQIIMKDGLENLTVIRH